MRKIGKEIRNKTYYEVQYNLEVLRAEAKVEYKIRDKVKSEISYKFSNDIWEKIYYEINELISHK